MKGSRPEQAVLTRDTDMSKTDETRRVIETMVDGLNDHRIDDIGEFFSQGFRWMGNQGCGTKTGLQEFQDNWQRPFQAAFSDKVCIDEARLYMGEWAAAFGRQESLLFNDCRFRHLRSFGQNTQATCNFGIGVCQIAQIAAEHVLIQLAACFDVP